MGRSSRFLLSITVATANFVMAAGLVFGGPGSAAVSIAPGALGIFYILLTAVLAVRLKVEVWPMPCAPLLVAGAAAIAAAFLPDRWFWLLGIAELAAFIAVVYMPRGHRLSLRR